MNLRVLPEAVRETIAVALWYDEQRPGLGDDFLAELQHGFETIGGSTQKLHRLEGYSGPPDVRRFLLKRFPYVIIIVVREGEFLGVAVAHRCRRPFYWLGRMK